MSRTFRAGTLLAVALGAAACAKETPLVNVAGTCSATFNAQVCTWAHTRGDSLIDAGATVPLASIDSAPAAATGDEMAWPPKADAVLDLPASVQAKSGLTQFTMYWEATGHPPAPYLTPHFDFHFYTTAVADRAAITCADSTKPAALPEGYSLPDEELPPDMAKMMGVSKLIGICVPSMGMHSLPTAEMQTTAPFRGTMVIGYYQGKPIFIEPMISRAMLDEKKSFDLQIPTVPGLTTNYPRTFHAAFDSTTASYNFTYSNFAPGK